LAAVVTVTVTDEGAEPLSANEFGETEQVDNAGAPAQLKDTVWLNPPPGAIARV
jgi:hypothetical protein